MPSEVLSHLKMWKSDEVGGVNFSYRLLKTPNGTIRRLDECCERCPVSVLSVAVKLPIPDPFLLKRLGT